jgi:hypothetical protein
MARQAALPCLKCTLSLRRAWRHSARHRRLLHLRLSCGDLVRCFRFALTSGRACEPSRPGWAVQQAPCARIVVSVGRGPEASREPVYETGPRAPHPIPLK